MISVCNMKIQTLMENLLPLLTLRSCHRKLFCMSCLNKIPAHLHLLKQSRSNPENEPSGSNIKRPRRAEVNFLPNFPQGEGPSTLEHMRQEIVEEVKKKEKNLYLIRKMMQTTFALRRQTIVKTCPPVKELMDLWPALKMGW